MTSLNACVVCGAMMWQAFNDVLVCGECGTQSQEFFTEAQETRPDAQATARPGPAAPWVETATATGGGEGEGVGVGEEGREGREGDGDGVASSSMDPWDPRALWACLKVLYDEQVAVLVEKCLVDSDVDSDSDGEAFKNETETIWNAIMTAAHRNKKIFPTISHDLSYYEVEEAEDGDGDFIAPEEDANTSDKRKRRKLKAERKAKAKVLKAKMEKWTYPEGAVSPHIELSLAALSIALKTRNTGIDVSELVSLVNSGAIPYNRATVGGVSGTVPGTNLPFKAVRVRAKNKSLRTESVRQHMWQLYFELGIRPQMPSVGGVGNAARRVGLRANLPENSLDLFCKYVVHVWKSGLGRGLVGYDLGVAGLDWNMLRRCATVDEIDIPAVMCVVLRQWWCASASASVPKHRIPGFEEWQDSDRAFNFNHVDLHKMFDYDADGDERMDMEGEYIEYLGKEYFPSSSLPLGKTPTPRIFGALGGLNRDGKHENVPRNNSALYISKLFKSHSATRLKKKRRRSKVKRDARREGEGEEADDDIGSGGGSGGDRLHFRPIGKSHKYDTNCLQHSDLSQLYSVENSLSYVRDIDMLGEPLKISVKAIQIFNVISSLHSLNRDQTVKMLKKVSMIEDSLVIKNLKSRTSASQSQAHTDTDTADDKPKGIGKATTSTADTDIHRHKRWIRRYGLQK